MLSHLKRSEEIKTTFKQILKENDVEVMRVLLGQLDYADKKMLIQDDIDDHQNFPFLHALKNNLTLDIVFLLFNYHKVIDIEFLTKANSFRENALMIASMQGYKEIVIDLLPIYEKRNMITKHNDEGVNALMFAAMNGDLQILDSLIPYFEYYGSTTNLNKYGQSALNLAENKDNGTIVNRLLPIFKKSNPTV
jgi:ankyrin repeat protein